MRLYRDGLLIVALRLRDAGGSVLAKYSYIVIGIKEVLSLSIKKILATETETSKIWLNIQLWREYRE